MKRHILLTGGILIMAVLNGRPSPNVEQAQAESKKMRDLLQPWLDPAFEKAEGTDNNVRDFVAKTLPEIKAALPENLSAPMAKKRHVLVITANTLGALHAPGGAGFLILLREAARKYGAFEFTEVFSDNALDASSLEGYDAVIINGVSQLEKGGNADFYNKVLPEFVSKGGGVMATHGAALIFRHFPDSPYNAMLGAFTTPKSVHPGKHGSPFPVKVVEPDHPLTAAFRGAPQTVATKGQFLNGPERKLYPLQYEAPAYLADELYTFNLQSNADGTCRPLVVINKDELKPNQPQFPEDTPDFGYALIWVKRHGKGRVYYTQFGHNFSVFSVHCVARAMMDGLQYVTGDLAAPDAPPSNLTLFKSQTAKETGK